MSKETDKRLELRAYLLGTGDDQTEKEKIERRLMTDDDYFRQFLIQEEELIEDYADGELDSNERSAFEAHFLIPPDRRERLKFALLMKKHIEEEETTAAATADNNLIAAREETVSGKSAKRTPKKNRDDFRRIFLPRVPVAVAGLVLFAVVAAAGIFWAFNSRGSSTDMQQALASLNKAYASRRPLDSRISDFNYAPFNKFRNDEAVEVSPIDLNRAERIALDNASENPTAENLHLLARVYLAKKEFDNALARLAEAEKKSPQDAEILSDTGATLLEKSRIASEDGEKLTLVARAIENFDKALAVNPNLLPARFNKAVATEIYLPNRAKESWREYLELDPASDWANEARIRLDALNKRETQNISSAEELESAFLKAYDDRDAETALRVVSQNRELISKKYLPQKLSAAFTEEKKTKEIESSNS